MWQIFRDDAKILLVESVIVLLVTVCTLVSPTITHDAFGIVNIFVVHVVIPYNWNCIFLSRLHHLLQKDMLSGIVSAFIHFENADE